MHPLLLEEGLQTLVQFNISEIPTGENPGPHDRPEVGATPTAIQPPLCSYIVTQCLNICLEVLHPLPEFSPGQILHMKFQKFPVGDIPGLPW